jgi:hypothetical protein
MGEIQDGHCHRVKIPFPVLGQSTVAGNVKSSEAVAAIAVPVEAKINMIIVVMINFLFFNCISSFRKFWTSLG